MRQSVYTVSVSRMAYSVLKVLSPLGPLGYNLSKALNISDTRYNLRSSVFQATTYFCLLCCFSRILILSTSAINQLTEARLLSLIY